MMQSAGKMFMDWWTSIRVPRKILKKRAKDQKKGFIIYFLFN